jgi:hypothetical protein
MPQEKCMASLLIFFVCFQLVVFPEQKESKFSPMTHYFVVYNVYITYLYGS